ncbi:MAG: DUF418 domain-containing protein [Ferruginibacter sp.]
MTNLTATQQDERAAVLDILRGIALLGICLANYPVLSLYIFQAPAVWQTMPTPQLDEWLAYIHFVFIDGKFYSLFSLLFGIGFSIILLRSQQKNKNGLAVFYRRLFILLLIGLAHALLFWVGDILLLYALVGMLLPLFRQVSDRNLVIIAVCLILAPIAVDALKVVSDNSLNLSTPLQKLAYEKEGRLGITDSNFGTWLIEHRSYKDIFAFNRAEIFFRYQDLINSNRPLKVLAMFLLGLYAGRKMIYAKPEENQILLRQLKKWGLIIGLPLSCIYAYLELNGAHIPDPKALLTTAAYALSVIPLSLGYTGSIVLWYARNKQNRFLLLFAAPGRMALTNYIMQTILGITIFYGIGFGLGGRTGLSMVCLIAIGVYIFEMIFSHYWLKYFNYGPLEWIWRMLTYGKYLPIKKTQ